MMNISSAMALPRIEYNGRDSIKDGVTAFRVANNVNQTIPHCGVQLYDQDKRSFIFETFSDAKGVYSFNNINLRKFNFFIISHHPTGEFNGEIADNLGGANVDK